MVEPYLLSARETVKAMWNNDVTAEECVHSIFTRIEEVENKIKAFITLKKDFALERAKAIDRKKRRGKKLGKLSGVCIALKDNICTKKFPTSCASRMLKDFIPSYNATVVEDLLKEDAIIIGKTNMDEFAMGSSTETSYFGPTRNPINASYVPGGSSGGSAAALASKEAILALGSDTGGSVRCPASFCSVVGLKPTYGLVSRYGLIAYANSLEQIGPLGNDVFDCALLLSIIAHHDPQDVTSINRKRQNYTHFLSEGLDGLKIGIPKEFFSEGVDERVAKFLRSKIDVFEKLGASCEECSLPTVKYSLPAYYLIAMSEASSNLARYDGVRYGHNIDYSSANWDSVFSKNRRIGFGAEVRRRIILGTYALSSGYYDMFYLKALKVRTLINKDFETAFKDFDILISPTMPILPFKIGEKISDPLTLFMCDILTVPQNLIGCPAISIPCGFIDQLPVGMQITAPPLQEALLLKTAYNWEKFS
ncbi:MAG: Asp-tRNA(Asn)/Glu-tRNA(Gln) amidotransferase subunit GatA [Candidatus Hodarchaeota archaeon]